ncbi:DUF5133 domain-containing protein [Streptomyces sp. NBC_00198]|uniref:DUF5133 domain-containing protein n=1 Tax=Streptomyces sp. NBC_00198 TaxID=2975677 RepID=UPI002255F2B5|nr:DUF5133 domain-containing protein [Streptomyces sp. NBC_00198]MCX5285827.1 DUF5133 domain-containing protein [Streptomyces sp. NBC_00198]
MLMPLPATLRRLVKEYETLLAEETLAGVADPSRRLRDLAYTLCVSTGTREITAALDAARSFLANVPASTHGTAAAMTARDESLAAVAAAKPSSEAARSRRAAGAPSPTRRDLTPRPGHRPAVPSGASAGTGSGR